MLYIQLSRIKTSESNQLTGVQYCPDIYCAIFNLIPLVPLLNLGTYLSIIRDSEWRLYTRVPRVRNQSKPIDLDNFKIFAFLGQHTEGSNLGGGLSLVGNGRKTTTRRSRPVQINTTGTDEPSWHKRRHTTSGCYSGRGNGNSRYVICVKKSDH